METKVLTAPKEEKAVVYAAADGQEVDWGSWRWPLADAPSLPLAPGILPVTRNPFGACVEIGRAHV